MKTIIPFSGGLDSTYALWKVLTDTQDEVTAVCFSFAATSAEDRANLEVSRFSTFDDSESLQKMRSVIEWLRLNVRDFIFEELPISADYFLPDQSRKNSPSGCLTRYAISRINAKEIDQIIVTNEKENDGFSNGGSFFSEEGDVVVRRTGAWNAYEEFVANATRGKISFPLIDSNYTQGTALKELPAELIQMTAHKEHAETWFKGEKRKFFKKLVDEGKTNEEMYQIYMSKCVTSDGRWISMKDWILNPDSLEGEIHPDRKWDMPTWPSSYIVPSSENSDSI
jgi:hypothetical protein